MEGGVVRRSTLYMRLVSQYSHVILMSFQWYFDFKYIRIWGLNSELHVRTD